MTDPPDDPPDAVEAGVSGESGEEFLGVGAVDGLAGRGFQRCALILAGHEADRVGRGEGEVAAVEHMRGLGDLQQAGQGLPRWTPGVDTESTPVVMPWLSMNFSAAGGDQGGRSMPPGRMPLSRSQPA